MYHIQVLRDHRFDPNCLVRRSAPTEDIENGTEKKNGENGSDHSEGPNKEVVLWTNHRVMEWLRVVDLAEYAPNLRGSGKFSFVYFISLHILLKILLNYFISYRCAWGSHGP